MNCKSTDTRASSRASQISFQAREHAVHTALTQLSSHMNDKAYVKASFMPTAKTFKRQTSYLYTYAVTRALQFVKNFCRNKTFLIAREKEEKNESTAGSA